MRRPKLLDRGHDYLAYADCVNIALLPITRRLILGAGPDGRAGPPKNMKIHVHRTNTGPCHSRFIACRPSSQLSLLHGSLINMIHAPSARTNRCPKHHSPNNTNPIDRIQGLGAITSDSSISSVACSPRLDATMTISRFWNCPPNLNSGL